MTLQQRIWEIVEMHETQEAYWFDKFIITLISLNLVAFVLETDPDLAAEFGHWFHTFDAISIGIFTVELAARLYACPTEQRFRRTALFADCDAFAALCDLNPDVLR
jgi:voltage-gated potassium channel